jgi:aromatic-amino-acid transaminase
VWGVKGCGLLQDPNRSAAALLGTSFLPYDAPSVNPPASRAPVRRLVPAQSARQGDDPIFALNAEANRRKRAGEDILNSTLGSLMDDEGRLAVIPAVAEGFRRIAPERAAGYAPIAGPTAFLEAVRRDVFEDGPLQGCSTAVATPGGSGAIYLAITNFLEPGQSLLTSSYYWTPYETIAHQAGRRVETYSMFASGGGLDVASLERALAAQSASQDRVLLVLNTPCHNPTGYSLEDSDWEALLPVLEAAAERTRLTLLVDVAYARYAGQAQSTWARRLEPLVGKATVLVAWSASKAFAQYGSRVGACLAVEEDPEELERIRQALGFSCRGTWSNCNHYGMLAVTECLTDPELSERTRIEREGLRRLLFERAERFNQAAPAARLSYPRYRGGFFVTVFTPDSQRTAAVMRERGVYVVPMLGAVRVAICSTPSASIERLVEALAAGLRAAGA